MKSADHNNNKRSRTHSLLQPKATVFGRKAGLDRGDEPTFTFAVDWTNTVRHRLTH
jgi:hypothetical protein